MPPVTLFEHAFHDREVVTGTNKELLSLVDLLRVRWSLTGSQSTVSKHIGFNYTGWNVVGREDRLVEEGLHLILHIQDKFSTVEELSKG